MIITEEWLEEKDACTESVDYAKDNDYLNLTLEQSIDMLIYHDRFEDANWLLTRFMNKIQCVKYAVYAAEQVINIFEAEYPCEERPRIAIEAAKAWIENPCEETRMAAEAAAAYGVNAAANTAYAAAAAAAYTAYTAAYTANAAYGASYASNNDKKETQIKILMHGLELLK